MQERMLKSTQMSSSNIVRYKPEYRWINTLHKDECDPLCKILPIACTERLTVRYYACEMSTSVE